MREHHLSFQSFPKLKSTSKNLLTWYNTATAANFWCVRQQQYAKLCSREKIPTAAALSTPATLQLICFHIKMGILQMKRSAYLGQYPVTLTEPAVLECLNFRHKGVVLRD